MKFEKIYTIGKWTESFKTINNSISHFFEVFNFSPNILEATYHTFSQIDFLVNEIQEERQRVTFDDYLTNTKRKPTYDDRIELGSFIAHTGTEIDFAINNELDDRTFKLIYDSDPEWENESPIIYSPVEEKIEV